MRYHDYFIEKSKYWKRKIKKHYKSHNIKIKITGCQISPSLQRYFYNIKPAKGNREQAILDRADDIQSSLELPLFYAYKDGLVIRLVVSEHEFKENKLLNILRSPLFSQSDMEIPLAIGYGHMGNMHIADLAKLRHLLIVGPSGTGKSVTIQCLILSIIVKCPVNVARLIVFEIGANSLSAFSDVLHLHHPIVKDVSTGIIVLESLVSEMNDRYALGEKECQSLPYIICIIDEFDDTIASIEKDEAKKFTTALDSLIRRGRKSKIVLVLASHNPTLKTTGINVNGIVSRISFHALKHQNSSTAIGVSGTEKLAGDGAMIFKTPGKVEHLQGSWVTDEEIEQILSSAPVGYDNIDMLKIREPETPSFPIVADGIVTDAAEKELAEITFWTMQHEKTSARHIRQSFRIGNRADKIIDALHAMGIITDKFANQQRDVLIARCEDLSKEVIGLLSKHGYTTEQIQEVLVTKCEKLGGVI